MISFSAKKVARYYQKWGRHQGFMVVLFAILSLTGCGGPGYLLGGLVADSIIDGWRPQGEAEDGTHCWDANENGECDDEDDVNGDEVCTVEDCVGIQGPPGADGNDGGDGLPGPQGEPGETTIIIVKDNEPDRSPPFGRGPGNHPEHPDHD